MKFLKALFSGKPEQRTLVFDAPVAPTEKLFVVGDIHGCSEQLDAILQKRPDDAQLVFVGDIVDRGPATKSALNRVHAECQNGAVCLMGNHEKMMLDFIDDPAGRAKRWLRHGGLQTVYDFKVPRVAERNAADDLRRARDILRENLGADLLTWLSSLPLRYQSGNLHVVHAAADPAIPLDNQENATFLWGHKDFLKTPRQDGQWICYGHTIVPEPTEQDGRIAIDTGAYATNRLSAAIIAPDDIRFISV